MANRPPPGLEQPRESYEVSLNGNPPASDKTLVAVTIMPVAELDATPETGGLPTRREMTVIAVLLAVVIASVVLLVVAGGQLAAALIAPA